MENEHNTSKTEVEQLADRLESQGVKNFHVTLAEGCTASAEEIAAEINRVDKWLEDPANRLTSTLRGEAFLHHDAAHPQVRVLPGGVFEPIPVTQDQKEHQRTGDLLIRAAEMIESLQAQLT